jgi:5-methylcytosine-specific restriction endonuclease McrA
MSGFLYGRKWRKARRAYLAEHPFCVMCQREGRMTLATVVDHTTPHRGSPALFWDVANWQSLCELHHNAAKQAEEKSGAAIGCDCDGVPNDPQHHWR